MAEALRRIPAFICDLDGTVALHSEEERGHFEYSKVSGDRPNKPVIDIVQRIARTGLPPVFMSGRADELNVRQDTAAWLVTHVTMGWTPQALFMRPEFLPDGKRDFRPDYIVKEELYREYVEPYYDILFAIDDRPQVIDMWDSIGIPVIIAGIPWNSFKKELVERVT